MNRPDGVVGKFLLAAAFAALATDAAAQAESDQAHGRVTFGTEIVATSHYIWRGFDEGEGMRVQPNVWLSVGGFQFSSWFDLAPRRQSGSTFTENDLTAEYGRTFGAYELRGGWTGYFLPGDEDGGSQEVFVSAAREGIASPSLSVYHDYRRGNGTYVNAAVEHAWPSLVRGIELSSRLGTGYNHHQWTTERGFSDANLGLRATWRAAMDHIEISPFVNYSRSLDRDIGPSRVYGGVELAFYP